MNNLQVAEVEMRKKEPCRNTTTALCGHNLKLFPQVNEFFIVLRHYTVPKNDNLDPPLVNHAKSPHVFVGPASSLQELHFFINEKGIMCAEIGIRITGQKSGATRSVSRATA